MTKNYNTSKLPPPPIQVIKAEIKWCEDNRNRISQEYETGFIQGLKQALKLITPFMRKNKHKSSNV